MPEHVTVHAFRLAEPLIGVDIEYVPNHTPTEGELRIAARAACAAFVQSLEDTGTRIAHFTHFGDKT